MFLRTSFGVDGEGQYECDDGDKRFGVGEPIVGDDAADGADSGAADGADGVTGGGESRVGRVAGSIDPGEKPGEFG